jgi:hypothetical protein
MNVTLIPFSKGEYLETYNKILDIMTVKTNDYGK